MILQNMGKEKEKTKNKNTPERENIDTNHMGIVNYTTMPWKIKK